MDDPIYIVPVAELESGHLNEPQSSNYFIQFLRSIRTKTNKTYSIDQHYFHPERLNEVMLDLRLENIVLKQQGYFLDLLQK